MRVYKTRFAPTPSGFLHLGNVFSFVVAAALAACWKAHTLLRIDDMDRERVNPAYVQDIFDTLRFLNIPWDQGPVDVPDFELHFSQRHRLPIYRQALAELKEKGMLFA